MTPSKSTASLKVVPASSPSKPVKKEQPKAPVASKTPAKKDVSEKKSTGVSVAATGASSAHKIAYAQSIIKIKTARDAIIKELDGKTLDKKADVQELLKGVDVALGAKGAAATSKTELIDTIIAFDKDAVSKTAE